MPVNGLFGTTIELLGKNIDLRARNQNMIAANVANAETPNYVPSSLSFEDELKSAITSGGRQGVTPATTNPRHIPLKGKAANLQGVQGRVVETPASSVGRDGNAVELEAEMSRMAENQIMYNADIQLLTHKFSDLKYAIKEK